MNRVKCVEEKTQGVGCIIMNSKREILIGKRVKSNKDEWGLIGGKVEKGETPTECVVREIREESGIEPKDIRFIGCHPSRTNLNFSFVCEEFEGKPRDNKKEMVNLKWVDCCDIKKYNLIKASNDTLDLARNVGVINQCEKCKTRHIKQPHRNKKYRKRKGKKRGCKKKIHTI